MGKKIPFVKMKNPSQRRDGTWMKTENCEKARLNFLSWDWILLYWRQTDLAVNGKVDFGGKRRRPLKDTRIISETLGGDSCKKKIHYVDLWGNSCAPVKLRIFTFKAIGIQTIVSGTKTRKPHGKKKFYTRYLPIGTMRCTIRWMDFACNYCYYIRWYYWRRYDHGRDNAIILLFSALRHRCVYVCRMFI